jgi:hypothetical protein
VQILDHGAKDAMAIFQTLVRELALIASYKALGPLPLAFSSHQLDPHPSKIGLHTHEDPIPFKGPFCKGFFFFQPWLRKFAW